MSEHLRYLSRNARIPLSVMPNAGLPELGPERRDLPADPAGAGHARCPRSSGSTALALVGGCCGTTPEHLRQVVEAVREVEPVAPQAARRGGRVLALPVGAVPAGRRRADDRRADERQRLQGVPRGDAGGPLGRLRRRSPAARSATARTCSTSASTTSAGTAPATCGRSPAGSPPPSTLPIDARLHRAAGDRGRAGDARRPLRGQLGQLRGRRRARLRGSPGRCRSSRSTAPRSSH